MPHTDLPAYVCPAYLVGVTGHMDLDPAETARLKKEVEKFFRALKGEEEHRGYLPKGFPPLTATPIVVLSSLAPGADTLVAEVALALNLEVRAPLPFPPDIYASSTSFQWKSVDKGFAEKNHISLDDSHGGSVSKFGRLRSKIPAERMWQVMLPEDEERPPMREELQAQAEGKLSTTADIRHKRYAASGEYVARHSNLLIAILDRSSGSNGEGGSWDTAVGKLEGFVPGCLPHATEFSWSQAGAVVRFPCRRQSNPAGGAVGMSRAGAQIRKTVHWLYPGDLRHLVPHFCSFGEENKEAHRHQCEKVVEGALELNEFNKLTCPHSAFYDGPAQQEQAENKEAQSLLGATFNYFPGDARAALTTLGRVRRRAADTTRRLSGKKDGVTHLLFLVALGSAISLHLWADPPVELQWLRSSFLLAAILIAIIGWAVYQTYESNKVELRNHDWRVLAEGLRVQFFWASAGIDRSVATGYMQRQRNELDWIRRAIGSLASPYHRWKNWFAGLRPAQQIEVLERIQTKWLNEQKRYFTNESDRSDHKQHTWHELASCLVVAAIILAVLAGVIHGFPSLVDHLGWTVPVGLWTVPVALLVLWAWSENKGEREKERKLKKHQLKGPLQNDINIWRGLQLLVHKLFPSEIDAGHTDPWRIWYRLQILFNRLSKRDPDARLSSIPWCRIWRFLWPHSRNMVCLRHTFVSNVIGLILALVIALGALFCCELLHSLCDCLWGAKEGCDELNPFSVVGVGTLLLVGALAVAWREALLYSEHSRQYHTMASLYTVAEDRMGRLIGLLKSSPDPAQRRQYMKALHELLAAVGREALDENAEWLILHRSRPLEPVHG